MNNLTGRVALQYRIDSGSWFDINAAEQTIPETANYIKAEWGAASDPSSTYYLYMRQNAGPWVNIYTGKNRMFTQNIGPGNQGSYYDYFVRARSSKGEISQDITSIRFDKNVFTAATLTSTTNVTFETSIIDISYEGANNTNTSAVFTYYIKCNEIPLYNGDTIEEEQKIVIWKDGDKPLGAYFEFDDIKNRLSSTEYKGDIVLILETTNKYETTKQTKFYVEANLQTEPQAIPSVSIDLDGSSSYITFLDKSFIIPDKDRYNLVSWEAGYGKLGENISYEIYASYDAGKTSSKIAEVNSDTLTYSHTINKLTNVAQIRYTVRIKTDYGLFVDTDSTDYTMHYINEPVTSVEDTFRSAEEFSFYFQVKTNTSIPKEEITIETIGSWTCSTKDGSHEVSNGNLTTSQNRQRVNITNLTDAEQFTVYITYNDNTGLFADRVYPVSIGSNLPVVLITKFGLGVGGVKPNKDVLLNVGGVIKSVDLDIENPITAVDLLVGKNPVYHTGRKPLPLEIGALGNSGPQVLSLGGNSKEQAFTIKGSIRELSIWTGSGGVAIETPEGTPLYMGSGSNEDIIIKSDVIALNKGISFPAKAAWRSVDISRSNGELQGTARYGIGANGDVYSPTIEYHRFADSTNSLRSRLDLLSTSLRLSSHGSDDACWMGFYKGYATDISNRIGWVGYSSSSHNKDISIGSTNNFRIYTNGSSRLWTFKAIGNTNYGIAAGETMIKTYGTVAEIQCRNAADSAYGRMLASAFVPIASSTYQKEARIGIDYNALLMENDISSYTIANEEDEARSIGIEPDIKIGFVLEKLSPLGLAILNPTGTEGIDLYSMSSVLWKIAQNQENRIKVLEEKLLFQNS